MQGLWSNHRKTKLNLNNSASPTPLDSPVSVDPLSTIEEAHPAANVALAPVDSSSTSTPTAKRKLRSSKTVEGTTNKRSKNSTASSASIAKQHDPPSTRLSDLGGVEPCVEKMLELVAMPLCHPEVYLHTGVQPPRGVLLHGPPGCGKTLLAHAIAGVCLELLPFFTLLIVHRNLVFHSLASLLHL
jgi:ribosome biogenesis ATPase